jgi:membrane protease YdiL (CAAX protease family)
LGARFLTLPRWIGVQAGVFAAIAVTYHGPVPAIVRPYVAPVLLLYVPFLVERRLTTNDVGLTRVRGGVLAAAISGIVILGSFFVVTRFILWGPWRGIPGSVLDRIFGELAFAALPEELFYRGWLLPSAAALWPRRLKVLPGVELTAANAATSAGFAWLHLASTPDPGRLAVFFPGLWFGWLTERTGSIWPAVILHALSNLLMAAASGR